VTGVVGPLMLARSIVSYFPPRNGLSTEREVHMTQEMVLLQAVDGTWEGWRCMAREEFLQRLDLGAWRDGQLLIGTLLPHRRVSQSDPSHRSEPAAE
jgi:hypothetical protein